MMPFRVCSGQAAWHRPEAANAVRLRVDAAYDVRALDVRVGVRYGILVHAIPLDEAVRARHKAVFDLDLVVTVATRRVRDDEFRHRVDGFSLMASFLQ